jgi:hypothetical protein
MSDDFPPKPAFPPLVSNDARAKIFGRFAYVAAPTSDNPEAIRITDNWQKENIVWVPIPQMAKKGLGDGKNGGMYLHKLGVSQLLNLWDAWDKAGLLDLVLEFDGSFAPRFVRGSKTSLSNHAWGCAFDINYQWNQLGHEPAPVGAKGSVRKLVPIANAWGFFWGGHYSGRKDGMHFELTVIMTAQEIAAVAAGSIGPLNGAQASAEATGSPPAPPEPAATPKPLLPTAEGADPSIILQLAGNSDIARYNWKDRGRAPAGYIKGVALTFALVHRAFLDGDPAAVEMAKANTGDDHTDALSWLNSMFRAAGMDNSKAEPDTLRHLFVLLIGLGMRESSGQYCEGRDRSAHNMTADTAEAGAWQQSWDSRTASPLIPQLFAKWKTGNPDGFLDIFKEGVHCTSAQLENYGTGEGRDFQALCKSCPAFAAQVAAVGLRNIRTHWGPINRREVEIRREADRLLRQVQDIVEGVLWVQQSLNALGADPKLDEDGDIGPATRGLLARFQRENNLSETGYADRATVAELERHLAKMSNVAADSAAPAHDAQASAEAKVPCAAPSQPAAAPNPHSSLADSARALLHHIFG